MADRVKTMKRLLAVQQKMVQIAEWRLGALNRQATELKEDQVRLREFMGGDERLSPLLSAAAFKRGKMLQVAIVGTEAKAVAQSRHRDAMRRKEKLAEKLVDKIAAQADREAEKRELADIIDAMPAKDDASFP
jgi:hypothetical protein